MKPLIKYFLIITTFMHVGLKNVSAQAPTKSVNPKEKKAAAQIKQYWFVMLTKGKKRDQDSAAAQQIQSGHMANINRLFSAGKLKVAGPFGDDGNWLGIFIFDCETKDEVEKLLSTDPAIASGRLAYDIRPWWTEASGSFKPGIPEIKN